MHSFKVKEQMLLQSSASSFVSLDGVTFEQSEGKILQTRALVRTAPPPPDCQHRNTAMEKC